MGWRTTLGVTLATAAVAGCLGSPSPSPSPEPSPAVWEAEILSPLGKGIPVTLTDFTGVVTGAGDGDRVRAGSRSVQVLDRRGDLLLATPLVPAALPGVSDDVGLQRPLGRGDQILLAWAAEDCHEEMIVTAFPGRAAALEVAR